MSDHPLSNEAKNLKARVVAIAAAVAALALFIGNVDKIIKTLRDWNGRTGELTLTVSTVLPVPCLKDSSNPIPQQGIVVLGFNNPTALPVVIRSVNLDPIWVSGGMWGGITSTGATYKVSIDTWYNLWLKAYGAEQDDALYKQLSQEHRLRIAPDRYAPDNQARWVRPSAIQVMAIAPDYFAIPAGKQEKIELSLGLSNSNYYLYGDLRVNVRLDNDVELNSEPIAFSVCRDDS